MTFLFTNAILFDDDISMWSVSRVTNMAGMFMRATSFGGDISKWDVSSVTDMTGTFRQAKVFNQDLSAWDVSRVTSMDEMFLDAVSFRQTLCGVSWVNSKAQGKKDMFEGSRGSIAPTACTSPPASTTARVTRQHASRRPIPGRELIIRTPISISAVTSVSDHILACPRCGTFRKSGRVSCCAPGGAWFRNCGGRGSKHLDHRWSEGVKACKRKCKCNNRHSTAIHFFSLFLTTCLLYTSPSPRD